jgi:hypothetical protein
MTSVTSCPLSGNGPDFRGSVTILSSYLYLNLPNDIYVLHLSIKVFEEFLISRLRVFENRVLRIFGPRRDEVTGGWRKLHNEEFHNL